MIMKKLLVRLLFVAAFTTFFSCTETKKDPRWRYTDELELAHTHINRIVDLSDDGKFLGIFKKAGERKQLIRTGNLEVIAFINLEEVKVVSGNSKCEYTIKCPKIEIKTEYTGTGKDKDLLTKIDTKEGRRYFTAKEQDEKIVQAVKKMVDDIEDGKYNLTIKQLIKEAKASARHNLPQLMKNAGFTMDVVHVEFDDNQKNDKSEENDNK